MVIFCANSGQSVREMLFLASLSVKRIAAETKSCRKGCKTLAEMAMQNLRKLVFAFVGV